MFIRFLLKEVTHSERPELFVRKLNQCSVLFDFNDASSELKGKQIKAAALHDMLEYITTQRGVITENIYPEVVKMVRSPRFYPLRLFADSPHDVIVPRTSLPQICSDRSPHK